MTRRCGRYWRAAIPDAASQHGRIRRAFPGFRMVRQGRAIGWVGSLQPRPDADYTVHIQYRGGRPPKVFMIDPQLDERCPHIYGDKSLCVYWPYDPDNPGWEQTSWIADTIIPWTAVWLHYYELWLETGEWLGPEKTHGSDLNLKEKTPWQER